MKKFIHICNISTPEHGGGQNICSYSKLVNFKEETDSIYLLNIHLNWDGRKLSSNFGFEIANLLRTKKRSKAPIVFYSPILKKYFEKKSKKDIRYKILFAPGSAFLELPSSIRQLNNKASSLPIISSACLLDISLMLCDIKGLILDKLNHNLKFGRPIEPTLLEAEQFFSLDQMHALGWHNFKKEISKCDRDQEKFENCKKLFLAQVNCLLVENSSVFDSTKTNFEILLIDDDPDFLELANKNLSNSFKVNVASKVQDAFEKINYDKDGKIKVVISDWRLYTDDSQTYWQPYQGYDVLQFAGKSGVRELIALTSQADFIVNHIRNSQDLKITLYKKQYLIDKNQWKMFSNMVYEKCLETLSKEVDTLSSKTWSKTINETSYKQLYFTQKSSLSGKAFFADLEAEIQVIWDYILGFSENDFRDILNIKEKFEIEISKNKLDLKIALIHRRLWIGLWHYLFDKKNNSREDKKITISKIFKIVCWGNYGSPTDNDIGAELNKIFLQKKDFVRQNYLPEEKTWLREKELI